MTRILGELLYRGLGGLALGQSAGTGITMTDLLRDEFITDDANPLTTPRTCEPGPGTLVVVDTGAKFAIASGQLQFSGGSGASGDPAVWSNTAYTRATGLGLYSRVYRNGAQVSMGFDTNQSGGANTHVLDLQAAGTIRIANSDSTTFNGIVLTETVAINTEYRLATILRAAGAYQLIKGGTEFPAWTLLWVADQLTQSSLYANANAFSAGAVGYFDDLTVFQLSGGAFVADTIATLDTSNPTSDATYTGLADGILDLSFTLPGSPAAGQKIELRYRYQDASNYWTAYLLRNAGNTDWDFRLDSVAAGTPTNRINVTGVGNATTVRVIANGTKHNCFTRVTTVWTKRGAEVNVSYLDALTTLSPHLDAGAATQIRAFPRTSSAFSILDSL